MIAVFNTTPLISLAAIQKLNLLQQLFKSIYIPQAVYYEIKAKHSFAYQEVDADWIKVKVVQDKAYLHLLSNELDNGEAEALCLAKELVADTLVIDVGIRLEYKTYDYPPYPQLWGEFNGYVSILDLLANTGKDAKKYMESQTPNEIAVP